MKMPNWLRNIHWLFSQYRWYRKWYGGRWEKWDVDFPICSFIWHQEPLRIWYGRPSPLCRGTAILIEKWD